MKKRIIIVLSVILLSKVMLVFIQAQDLEFYLESLNEIIPNEVKDSYSDLSLGAGLPDFSDICLSLSNEIKARSVRPVKMLFNIIIIVVASSIYHSYSDFLKNKRIQNVFDTLCSLVMSVSVLSISCESLDQAYDFIKRISQFSISLFPLTSSVCILSGNITEATVSSSALLLFVGICDKVMCMFLIPVLKIMLALSVCSSANSLRFDLGGLVKFLKGVFATVIGFAMMLFVAVLSYQSIIAGASDSLGVKTIRFAAGSAIPIIGASLGEALRTVGGSLSLLKSTIGGVGVSVILLLLLPCVLTLLLERMAISVGVTFSRIFGCKRESELLESFLSVYGYTLALVCAGSIMLIFILSVFASTASSIGAI